MQWEHLTSPDFKKAAEETNLCVIPLGVIEKHGNHLPLGTDFLITHKIAVAAAEVEPAIVYPPFYYGQINEARPFPGTIAMNAENLVRLFQIIFDEISRNGIKKILLLNGHGGNDTMLSFLSISQLSEKRDYTLYVANGCVLLTAEQEKKWHEIREVEWGGHAGEMETSLLLAGFEELVKMEDIRPEPGKPLGRQNHLTGLRTPVSWYANYPDHYAGDAGPSTKEKGELLFNMMVETAADLIRKVKNDTAAPRLMKDFFSKEKH